MVTAAMVAAGAFVHHRLATRVVIEPATLVAEQVPVPQPSSVVSPRAAVLERQISPPASATARPRSTLRSAFGSSVTASPARAEPVTDATCRGWASQGRAERAVDCYQTLARESGIGAEVALYEAARLSAEVLEDTPRALTLLEQHATRFPDSALRIEVQWLKIRSLERAARFDEALGASEALLDSAAGRALAPKLHLLRGRIHAVARHDCAQALPEYVALLGEPGLAGDEAELNRAQCLEQLQRFDEARVAYRRYLDRSAPRAADVARARLNALSNPAQPSEGQP
ncbi:MAG TPA: tetratricopeptide repeat protein [Polyangiaceae bacterium]|nr:tetratricopeptide repeat protein [Polyangiaceae bacterium]